MQKQGKDDRAQANSKTSGADGGASSPLQQTLLISLENEDEEVGNRFVPLLHAACIDCYSVVMYVTSQESGDKADDGPQHAILLSPPNKSANCLVEEGGLVKRRVASATKVFSMKSSVTTQATEQMVGFMDQMKQTLEFDTAANKEQVELKKKSNQEQREFQLQQLEHKKKQVKTTCHLLFLVQF